ncbi:hypothetical protein ACWE42_24580, partial [Sutcliffiella cohnii]
LKTWLLNFLFSSRYRNILYFITYDKAWNSTSPTIVPLTELFTVPNGFFRFDSGPNNRYYKILLLQDNNPYNQSFLHEIQHR